MVTQVVQVSAINRQVWDSTVNNGRFTGLAGCVEARVYRADGLVHRIRSGGRNAPAEQSRVPALILACAPVRGAVKQSHLSNSSRPSATNASGPAGYRD